MNTKSRYQRHKQAVAERQAAQSAAGRDLGELPPVVDPERKAKGRGDFREFCRAYFAETFTMPWSADHLKVIAKIEEAVLHGGLFAVAMPRGSGKSSLCECACLWAVVYGHRDFVALIGSTEGHALDMLTSIRAELDGNDTLAADFPEVVYPISALEGIANRCAGQTCLGVRTHIVWTAREIVLPTIDGSRASGAIIKVAGITGRIRGMKHKKADGQSVRPSLVVIDDPQTDESARSLSQSYTRERVVAGAVLGLAGPGKKISGIMPCTVIRPGDMADNILNRDKHPEWNGERTKMVYSFPTDEKLWARYAEIRADGLRSGLGIAEATEFYRQNREAMDAGAVVAWPERFNHDELSAVQHSMNLKLQDERAFWAEYQNAPLPEDDGGNQDLAAEFVATKTSGYARGAVPLRCVRLTAFVDVHQDLLYWIVSAWSDNFSGWVIEYGTHPDQKRPYFTLRDAKPTLGQQARGAGVEGAVLAGLMALTDRLMAREFRREDGAMMRIERTLIDANWSTSTEVVYQLCRQSVHAAALLPSHGRYIGASGTPMDQWKQKPGDRLGMNWRMPTTQGKRAVRHVTFDANFWKTFCRSRLAALPGDVGSIVLWGDGNTRHDLFAEHMTAEYPVSVEAPRRRIDEWKDSPGRDNHWWDCLVGSAVAASTIGVQTPEWSAKPKLPRKSLAELAGRS